METPDQVLANLQSHDRELRQQLKECVTQHGHNVKTLKTGLTISSDEEIGSLIDARAVVNGDGSPVSAELDDCIRTQLQSLVLPPLKDGDEFKVNYVFSF